VTSILEALDVVSILERFSSVLTIDFVSIFGTEGFSSVLTLDIVSVFGIMDVK
jgi:hypothetical protein